MIIIFNSRIMHNSGVLPIELSVATGFLQRLRGLLLTKNLESTQGMYIRPCSQVHSFGMAYALEIVFLDVHSRVLKLDYLPKRCIRSCKDAIAVIELSEGSIQQHGIKLGDQFALCHEVILKGVLS